MITPRLFRRALRRSMQWRLLLLFWASLALPGLLAALPVFGFLRGQLDHSTPAAGSVAWLDGWTLIELARQLAENGAALAIGWGGGAAAATALLISPFVAGATVAAARIDEPAQTATLLAGAGELYGRMLRTFLAGLLPLGIGSAAAAGIFHAATRANERTVTEAAANRNLIIASVFASVVVFVAHLFVDAARAQFAAEPTRRSALAALWSGVRLVVRRPVRAPGLGALGAAIGLGGALALMALRLQIAQRGTGSIALAWLLAQGAHVVVGWGRAARIFGLADLSRADAADRRRREAAAAAAAEPQVVHSTTLSALEPPRSGASR